MNANRDTDTNANLESFVSDESLRAQEVPTFDTPVYITVHSLRYRLVDTEAISAKAAIDGLVKAGLLKDDTTESIEEIRYKQTKIPKSEAERTLFEIVEVGHD